ncbi:NF-kappa-B inhibitor epsilon [Megalops cyprinoides]|uniref:NF-kappa-B inhibitor epsilon n=1 Tax=Megalops cyprinoides TaxID=118141 RepID=UPI001864E787|nr:NF-kappa-B inhibitor epsilon [Megalops cyprinoides]
MAHIDDEKGKVDLSEDYRIDSGLDSLRSINKDEQCIKTVQKPSSEETDVHRDKMDSITEERLDSSYGSSSLTVDNLSEIIEGCKITEPPDAESAQCTDQEVNLLTTITEDGDTILHLAIIHEETEFALQLIQLFPKDVLDIQNNLYQTPLHLATYLDLPSVVQGLVQKQASLELQDQEGNTPLHVACDQGRGECAGEMTSQMSPRQVAVVVEIQNWRGLTCLHLATLRRNHRMVKLLMKKGANLNVPEGTSGKTALHMAVELHDVTMVKLLLNKGANVDAAMFNGCTPLHLAVGRQDAAMAHILCQSGADKMLKNMEDETPLDLADGNDHILALFPFDDIQISGRSVVGMKF